LITTVEAAAQRPILLIAATLILMALVHRRWPEQLQATARLRGVHNRTNAANKTWAKN
jgi:hypothetical protein